MEDGPRRSNRRRKPKRDPDCVYYQELEQSLSGEVHTSEVWQHRSTNSPPVAGLLNQDEDYFCSNELQVSTSEVTAVAPVYGGNCWSRIEFYSRCVNTSEFSNTFSISGTESQQVISRRRSHSARLDSSTFVDFGSAGASLSDSAVEVSGAGVHRRLSSTRGDFLDLTGNFLSMDGLSAFSGLTGAGSIGELSDNVLPEGGNTQGVGVGPGNSRAIINDTQNVVGNAVFELRISKGRNTF